MDKYYKKYLKYKLKYYNLKGGTNCESDMVNYVREKGLTHVIKENEHDTEFFSSELNINFSDLLTCTIFSAKNIATIKKLRDDSTREITTGPKNGTLKDQTKAIEKIYNSINENGFNSTEEAIKKYFKRWVRDTADETKEGGIIKQLKDKPLLQKAKKNLLIKYIVTYHKKPTDVTKLSDGIDIDTIEVPIVFKNLKMCFCFIFGKNYKDGMSINIKVDTDGNFILKIDKFNYTSKQRTEAYTNFHKSIVGEVIKKVIKNCFSVEKNILILQKFYLFSSEPKINDFITFPEEFKDLNINNAKILYLFLYKEALLYRNSKPKLAVRAAPGDTENDLTKLLNILIKDVLTFTFTQAAVRKRLNQKSIFDILTIQTILNNNDRIKQIIDSYTHSSNIFQIVTEIKKYNILPFIDEINIQELLSSKYIKFDNSNASKKAVENREKYIRRIPLYSKISEIETNEITSFNAYKYIDRKEITLTEEDRLKYYIFHADYADDLTRPTYINNDNIQEMWKKISLKMEMEMEMEIDMTTTNFKTSMYLNLWNKTDFKITNTSIRDIYESYGVLNDFTVQKKPKVYDKYKELSLSYEKINNISKIVKKYGKREILIISLCNYKKYLSGKTTYLYSIYSIVKKADFTTTNYWYKIFIYALSENILSVVKKWKVCINNKLKFTSDIKGGPILIYLREKTKVELTSFNVQIDKYITTLNAEISKHKRFYEGNKADIDIIKHYIDKINGIGYNCKKLAPSSYNYPYFTLSKSLLTNFTEYYETPDDETSISAFVKQVLREVSDNNTKYEETKNNEIKSTFDKFFRELNYIEIDDLKRSIKTNKEEFYKNKKEISDKNNLSHDEVDALEKLTKLITSVYDVSLKENFTKSNIKESFSTIFPNIFPDMETNISNFKENYIKFIENVKKQINYKNIFNTLIEKINLVIKNILRIVF